MKQDDTHLTLWLTLLVLSEQANRDWLTGLYNRRYFESTLADHIEAANRYSRELSLVLFDIDDFKQVNDCHGHPAGDAILRRFADYLTASARSADIVCRYGGDEFAVILPETDQKNAEAFVERIIARLASPPASDSEDTVPPPNYTVSGGVAALPGSNLVARADQALLSKKEAFRQ